jgi:type IV fimbrial biogenesis protein FimT
MPLNRARSPCGEHRGFTLIELMVALTVLAIILSLAAPAFGNLLASNRLSTQASELIGALNLARSEAVRRAQPVTLLAANANNYLLGWKVFPDANGNGAQATATDPVDGLPIRESNPISGSATIKRVTRSAAPPPFTYTTTTDAYLVFTSRGAIQPTTPVFFKVCDPANTAVRGRIVQVNVVGKVSLDSTSETCP